MYRSSAQVHDTAARSAAERYSRQANLRSSGSESSAGGAGIPPAWHNAAFRRSARASLPPAHSRRRCTSFLRVPPAALAAPVLAAAAAAAAAAPSAAFAFATACASAPSANARFRSPTSSTDCARLASHFVREALSLATSCSMRFTISCAIFSFKRSSRSSSLGAPDGGSPPPPAFSARCCRSSTCSSRHAHCLFAASASSLYFWRDSFSLSNLSLLLTLRLSRLVLASWLLWSLIFSDLRLSFVRGGGRQIARRAQTARVEEVLARRPQTLPPSAPRARSVSF
mmetsp:Transcript_15132/g.37192  ORF Transcript_15132/g.37192 Transcript_15132/m.37192 type:complete len:284 (+) Transcript_15132:476-1327(+)